jgi:hypothetical protein
MVMKRRCLLCGTANHTCGGPTDIRPVDEMREAVMAKGKLVRKDVTINGMKTTIKVREGEKTATDVLVGSTEEPKARSAKNKARTTKASE